MEVMIVYWYFIDMSNLCWGWMYCVKSCILRLIRCLMRLLSLRFIFRRIWMIMRVLLWMRLRMSWVVVRLLLRNRCYNDRIGGFWIFWWWMRVLVLWCFNVDYFSMCGWGVGRMVWICVVWSVYCVFLDDWFGRVFVV